MYIPVLHARRSEKSAVLHIKDKLGATGNVAPLFIPVKDSKKGSGTGLKGVHELIRAYSREKIPYFLLTTPYAKCPYAQSDLLTALATYDKKLMATPVVAVSEVKPLANLRMEIDALGAATKFAVLHVSEVEDTSKLAKLLAPFENRIVWHFFYDSDCGQAYCDTWSTARRALIRDGFSKALNNAAYASTPDEEISTLGFQYKTLGYQGFGDHTICGEEFRPGGGLANAITIHLTYPHPIGGPSSSYASIRVRHFVSDHVTKATPEATRFFESLKKLVTFYQMNRGALSCSFACAEFEQLLKTKSYPRLGPIKRGSIQHHIELMSHLDL